MISERLPGAHGLALLANKCASNTFDLSSGMVHASIRDQIVRAQLLLKDLKATDPNCARVLVVGAGLAGVSAACAASDLGIQAVLVEPQDAPFSLQASVSTRFVGPFMYEWPCDGFDQQNYPAPAWVGDPLPSTPQWSSRVPLRASDLAGQLTTWLRGHVFDEPEPSFFFGCPPGMIKAYVNSFVAHCGRLTLASLRKPAPPFLLPTNCTGRDGQPALGGTPFQPDYILLAVGMGAERVIHPNFPVLEGEPFWSDDDLRSTRHMNLQVGVLGSGDGALQDVLRLITRHDHPLDFIRNVESWPGVADLLDEPRRRLEAFEQQTRVYATWNGSDSYDALDRECSQTAASLASNTSVRAAVRAQLRRGTGAVHHVFRESHFGKSYLLNRFAVHLIEQCAEGRCEGEFVSYIARRGTEVASASAGDPSKGEPKYIVILSTVPHEVSWGRVVIRFGVDKDNPGRAQMIRIRAQTAADRTSLAGIPLPFVVPK